MKNIPFLEKLDNSHIFGRGAYYCYRKEPLCIFRRGIRKCPFLTGDGAAGKCRQKQGKMRMEKVLNFVMRGILGTIAIYFINAALAKVGVTVSVGINAATVLTSGILGFPGLLALYGLGFYRLL